MKKLYKLPRRLVINESLVLGEPVKYDNFLSKHDFLKIEVITKI